MNRTLNIFLIISLIGLAGFGAFGAAHSASTHGSLCVVSVAMGTDCPDETNTLDSISFHLNTVKDFSLGVLSGVYFGSLLALSLLFLFEVLYPASRLLVFSSPQVLFSRDRRKKPFIVQERLLTGWLALHENSPALV